MFDEDSSYYLLCSLENIDEDGRLESKADMFTKRTSRSCSARSAPGVGATVLSSRPYWVLSVVSSPSTISGEVYFRENSVMKPVELSDTAKGRVAGMIGLRQLVNTLVIWRSGRMVLLVNISALLSSRPSSSMFSREQSR